MKSQVIHIVQEHVYEASDENSQERKQFKHPDKDLGSKQEAGNSRKTDD
ncbi:hypothetical protein [Metabacillus fastidiosus]|nr:hypothetical protein [Metabacillus fastidiosus]MEC2074842.1 hypothetical protein [Metabacillus fastidiosus]